MSILKPRALAAIVAVAVLAGVPAVQAVSVGAAVLEIHGQQHHIGEALGLSLHAADGGIRSMTVDASPGYLLRWTQEGVFATCVAGPCDEVTQSVPTEEGPERVPDDGGTDLHARLLDADARHQVNVVPLGQAPAGVRMKVDGDHVRWSAHDDVCLTQHGLMTGDDANRPLCDGYTESRSTYNNVRLGQVQVYRSEGGNITLHGDMALELRGIALATDQDVLDTRGQRDAGPAGHYERVFGRLVLFGATVNITLAPGSDVQWAMQRGDAKAFDAVLTGRADTIQFGGQPVDLAAGGSVHGDFAVTSEATADGMRFAVHPHEAASAGHAPVIPKGWGMAALGLLGLLPLAGVVMVHRRQQPATMDGVEHAIRAGRFGRAVRLSDRILRDDPLHESAHLSRAIALTKSGRADAAVDSVQAYLEHAEPGDGTLHFVMGMALLDLGRSHEARQALGQAVERTPALLADVAPELRPVGTEAAYT